MGGLGRFSLFQRPKPYYSVSKLLGRQNSYKAQNQRFGPKSVLGFKRAIQAGPICLNYTIVSKFSTNIFIYKIFHQSYFFKFFIRFEAQFFITIQPQFFFFTKFIKINSLRKMAENTIKLQ